MRTLLACAIVVFGGCTSSNEAAGPASTDHDAGSGGGPADAISSTEAGDAGGAGGGAADAPAPRDGARRDAPGADGPLVTARPYNFKEPTGYDSAVPTPLVILLHGLGATGVVQDAYFGLGKLADDRTFLYAYPDGTTSSRGRFWNATDACCDFEKTGVDDVAYINAIIDDVSAKYNVDPKRVFIVGHSNGGYMSYRLACDIGPRIAGIVSLAGAMWKDTARCKGTSPVAVLQVHGDADKTVLYAGGGAYYPSAKESVRAWADKNGCDTTLSATDERLDLDAKIGDRQTRVERHLGCKAGAAELWTIEGGAHIPSLRPIWAATIYDWLMKHPK